MRITKFYRSERTDHLSLHRAGGDGDARAADEEARVQLEGQGSGGGGERQHQQPGARVRQVGYADDAATTFDTHEQLATPVIKVHHERYVLKMQVGTVTMPSKTEHMFILPHRNDVIDAADLAPVKADETGGVVTSTDFFKYLGGVDSVLAGHTNLFKSLTIVLVKAVRSENKWVYHLHPPHAPLCDIVDIHAISTDLFIRSEPQLRVRWRQYSHAHWACKSGHCK